MDSTPQAMRSAMRRNSQMKRQLSHVRKNLAHQEKEAHQTIMQGNVRLVAKLTALKVKSERKASERGDDPDDTRSTSNKSDPILPPLPSHKSLAKMNSTERLQSRSKLQRVNSYREPTRSLLLPITTDNEVDSTEKLPDLMDLILAPAEESPAATPGKYAMPSWQRAELLTKKKQEEEKNKKIYGKSRRR